MKALSSITKTGYILLALVAPLAAFVGARILSGERIDSYWTSVAISEAEDEAAIIEAIDYNFGLSARRGIFRTVPDLDPTSTVSVRSATAPTETRVSRAFETTIRIGDPDVTIKGPHRYIIEYPLNTLVVGDQFSWNAIGPEWEVPISNAEVHILSTNELLEPRCDVGRFGSFGGCTAVEVEPGHLKVEESGLGTREGVTVSATIGALLDQAPAAPATPLTEPLGSAPSVLIPMAVALLGVLAAHPFVARIVRLRGREQILDTTARSLGFIDDLESMDAYRLAEEEEMARLIYPSLTPPQGISAPHGGILIEEKVMPQHQVAWLLEAAHLDEVVIIESDQVVTLERGPATPRPTSRPILNAIFAKGDSVELKGYVKGFDKAWERLEKDLNLWRNQSGYWDKRGETQRAEALMFGALVGLIGIVLVALFSGLSLRWSPLWLVPLLGAALALGAALTAMTRSFELRIRTPLGTSAWIEVEALRRFLSELEPESALNMIEPDMFAGYTVWAYAFGLDSRWRRITRALENEPRYRGVSTNHFYLANVGSSISRSTRTASTPPSSSGGGGGGGGVGGGGGGGGGGSW